MNDLTLYLAGIFSITLASGLGLGIAPTIAASSGLVSSLLGYVSTKPNLLNNIKDGYCTEKCSPKELVLKGYASNVNVMQNAKTSTDGINWEFSETTIHSLFELDELKNTATVCQYVYGKSFCLIDIDAQRLSKLFKYLPQDTFLLEEALISQSDSLAPLLPDLAAATSMELADGASELAVTQGELVYELANKESVLAELSTSSDGWCSSNAFTQAFQGIMSSIRKKFYSNCIEACTSASTESITESCDTLCTQVITEGLKDLAFSLEIP